MFKRIISVFLTVALLLGSLSSLVLADESEAKTSYVWNGSILDKTEDAENSDFQAHFEGDDWVYFDVPEALLHVKKIGLRFTFTVPEGHTQEPQYHVLRLGYQADDGGTPEKQVFVGGIGSTKTVAVTLDNANFRNDWNLGGSFSILRGNYWAMAAGYYITKIELFDLTAQDTVTNTDPDVAKWNINEWDTNGIAVSAVERENDVKAAWLWFKVTNEKLLGAHDKVGVRVTFTASNPYTQVLLDDGTWHTVDNVNGGKDKAEFVLENVNFANDKREGDSSFRLLVGDYDMTSQSAMYLQSVELYLIGDKAALQTAVDGAKTSLSAYTEESAAAYTAALTQARATLENAIATQVVVDAALAALVAADEALVEADGSEGGSEDDSEDTPEEKTSYVWNGNILDKTEDAENSDFYAHFEGDDWVYFDVPEALLNVKKIGLRFTFTLPEGETQAPQYHVLRLGYQADDGSTPEKQVFVGGIGSTKTVAVTLDNANFQNTWNWDGSFSILRGNYWAMAAGYYITKIELFDLTEADTATDTDPNSAKWDINEWEHSGIAVSAVERENDAKASWLWFKVTDEKLLGAHDRVGVRVTFAAGNPYTQVLLDDGTWYTVDNVDGGTEKAEFTLENVNFANNMREGDSSFRLLVGDYGWTSQSAMYLQSVELYLIGDITALKVAVDSAKTSLSAYTEESAAAYKAALSAARNMLNNAVATQAEIDAALAALVAADEALVKAENPTLSFIDRVTTYGRTFVQDDTIFLFWSNSGVSFTFDGTGATADLSVNNTADLFRGYLQVYVDGEFMPSRTIELSSSQNSALVLAEGLEPGTHTIELRKRNEAVYGNSATIAINDIAITDGEFMEPPAAPTRVIEFVGDSLTTGFGNMRTDGSGDVDANGDIIYSTGTQDGSMSYAVLTAKELGAEANIIARSGIHYAKRTQDNIYDHYTNTATLPGRTSGNWVSSAAWDFEAHPNDVVVISLGSNDHHQDYTDEAFTEDAVAMIQLVREKNPNAVIIWTYGFAGDIIGPALQAAVKQVNDAGDDKVYYYDMAGLNVATEGVGTHGHPTIQAHINRSIGLAEFIAEKAGWEADATPFLNAQIAVSGEYGATEDALAGYTPVSAKAFTDAIAAGEALIQAGNGTKEQLIAAAAAIWNAQLGLVQLEDVSADYITVETYDTLDGLSSGAAELETEDYREGAGAVSKSGSSGTIAINKSGYNIAMPEDLENWYLEFWFYVDNPENLPTESCLEISQTIDGIEQQWLLGSLGLVSGWNKVQLRLTANDQFRTLQNVRCFLVDVQAPVTIKLDNMVIARGKVAADIEEWNAVIAAAEEKLAAGENAALSAALELAKTAVTQADVDAFTAILKKAMEEETPTAKLGDVDGDGEITSTDARLTLQYYAGKIGEDDLDLTVADVDGDSAVTSTDARLILQKYAGKIKDFPAK